MEYFLILLLIICVAALAYLSFSLWKTVSNYRIRFKDVLDQDREVEKLLAEQSDLSTSISQLRTEYSNKKDIYDRLLRQVAIFDEQIEYAEFGIYAPHFEFDTTEEYQERLNDVKDEQKRMVSDKTAAYTVGQWSVNGSEAKGRTMINRAIRLTLKAFNADCNAAVANVRWNNVERMVERIHKAKETIEKLNASMGVHISDEYVRLKVAELRLVHEHKEAKQKAKEEQAEIRRQIREEESLAREIEKAAREEEKFQKDFDKAKAQIEAATGAKLDALQKKLQELEKHLAEARQKNQRAKSMAEITRRGHVYVISNVGSFGEGVFKIGMTRRLDPMDRVKELGDASVPFRFDVHAMIYTDDAPALENALQKKFEASRLNLVNYRKEFFRISLDEIEVEAKKVDPEVEFIKTIEAREFNESKAKRELQHQKDAEEAQNEFPLGL